MRARAHTHTHMHTQRGAHPPAASLAPRACGNRGARSSLSVGGCSRGWRPCAARHRCMAARSSSAQASLFRQRRAPHMRGLCPLACGAPRGLGYRPTAVGMHVFVNARNLHLAGTHLPSPCHVTCMCAPRSRLVSRSVRQFIEKNKVVFSS